MKNSSGSCNCTLYIVVALIIAAIFSTWVTLEFVGGNIPFMNIAAWVVFGLGVLSLILLTAAVLSAALYRSRILAKCLNCFTMLLLISIITTILMPLFALAIGINVGVIAIIIFTVIGSFTFALMLLGLAGLLYCISSKLYVCVERE